MSDEAAAPVEAVEAPAEGGEAPAKVAPKVEEDPLDALLKTKPVKYKAAGKEKTITTSKDLQRLLSRVDGTDTAAAEALKVKQANDAREAKVKSLAKMPKAERLRVLEEMGIPRNVIFEAFEEDVLTSAEKEKAQAQLTPRERELQEKLEAHEARVADRVMRISKRTTCHQRLPSRQPTDRTIDPRRLDRFGGRQCRQDSRNSLG